MTSLVTLVASDQKGLPHWDTVEQTFHPEDEYFRHGVQRHNLYYV